MAFSVLLSACSDPQVSVYDDNGLLKGHVTVHSSTTATIRNKAGSIVGEVKEKEVLNRSGSKVGTVESDGDILNRNGTRVGYIKGESCRSTSDVERGHLYDDTDLEAAGGACLLLLLL